ncbi:hypothetical protein K7432_002821 [Basidiobolus ranarum]|uniref:ER membrane protein complex subunit 10 n=1 Tax=Basidiobolus ranarum TaxID=34480 RepID=A0ABR2X153_9FUNG
MKITFTLLLTFLCVSLAINGEDTQEQRIGVWHKIESQEEYIKRGEIVYTLKPKTAKYITDENSPQLKHSDNSLYTVKVGSLRENEVEAVTFSSVKWCMLEASQFSDKFTLHFDKEENFFHADYHPGAHDCQQSNLGSDVIFNTSVELAKPYYELRPKLQRINQEELKQKETAENTNFFMKYWYIIVPVVLVLLVGGGDAPKEG